MKGIYEETIANRAPSDTFITFHLFQLLSLAVNLVEKVKDDLPNLLLGILVLAENSANGESVSINLFF